MWNFKNIVKIKLTPANLKWSTYDGFAFIDAIPEAIPYADGRSILRIADTVGRYYDGIIYPSVGETTSRIYTSDFSAGTDGWFRAGGLNGTLTGNIDGIGGQDNNLKFQCDTVNSTHTFTKALVLRGGRFRKYVDYFVPSSNSNLNSFSVDNSISVNPATFDTWTTTTGEGNYDNYQLNCYTYTRDDGNANFQDLGGDDVLYFRNVIVDKILTPSTNGVIIKNEVGANNFITKTAGFNIDTCRYLTIFTNVRI
jgi:hypothetical protein